MRRPHLSATVRAALELPLRFADGWSATGRVYSFDGLADGLEHVALGLGPEVVGRPPLVRVHSECLTGDVLGSGRCDCGPQLRESVERIADAGGYLLYLRQEGRGIGLANKVRAYALQAEGADTIEANEQLHLPVDARTYDVAAAMLRELGVESVELLTNNPLKVDGLAELGIAIERRVPVLVPANPHSQSYLEVKRERMQHDLGAILLGGHAAEGDESAPDSTRRPIAL